MKNFFFGIIVCLCVLAASQSQAQDRPDTGQTKCYDNNAEISCPQPGEAFYGQDAEYIKARSYTDLGNGIVRDNITGLEWQQATSPETYVWWEAPGYCAGLSLGGHDDWRVPTIQELSSLVDSSRINPAIDPIFSTVADGYPGYWSSNRDLFDFLYVWMVAIDNAGNVYSVEDNAMLNVRAVRGNPLPVNNFTDNDDGTVTDTTTGLMWQQATAPGAYTWQGALAYCEDLDLAGHTDWRLPDRTELQSIVDYKRIDPVIDPLFSTVASSYWSSTTSALNTILAWIVSFDDYPVVSNRDKTDNNHVRAVRSGQYMLLHNCTNDSDCDDGIFCTGVETCVNEQCVAGTNPCLAQDLFCNEDVDQCVECLVNEDCSEGYTCVEGECVQVVTDTPPAIDLGPFVAAGPWPVLPTSPESPMYLKRNYSVVWTFSDDYASCTEACTHTAEYQALGSDTWIPLSVTTDEAGAWYASVDLPINQLQNAATYAFRFTVTDCAGQSTQSGEYYFKVARTDAPPVIESGPYLAAGSWPKLAIRESSAFVLRQNSDVLWTFSDDYAFCSGLCTHRARFRKVGDTEWTWLPVSTDPERIWYAYATLPVESLDAGTYYMYFDVKDCAGQITYAPRVYYFKVE